MVIKRIDEIPQAEVKEQGAVGVSLKILAGKDDGAPNFVMRHFTIEKGGHTPFHSHAWEHEVFVLNGRGKVRSKEGEIPLTPGMAVFVPPNEMHSFVADEKESLSFICVIPRID
jgi:quercetin dioxygenase-like cupin family protein